MAVLHGAMESGGTKNLPGQCHSFQSGAFGNVGGALLGNRWCAEIRPTKTDEGVLWVQPTMLFLEQLILLEKKPKCRRVSCHSLMDFILCLRLIHH